jgi:hypothetical protein
MSMSADCESLSSILSGSSAIPSAEPAKAEPAADVKPEPAKEPETAEPSSAEVKTEPETAKPEPVRDEKGKFTKAETKPEKTEQMVPLSALLAERAKRREPEAPKPKTSVLENEDQAFSERITEHIEPLKQAVFEMSVDFARTRFDDFDELAGVFSQAANNDERLWQQMRDSKNPAMYVYQVGKQFKELAPFGGDLLKYREHVASESKTELTKANERLATLTAEIEALKKGKTDLEAVPRSLNKAASGASPSAGDVDPEPITKIARFGNT